MPVNTFLELHFLGFPSAQEPEIAMSNRETQHRVFTCSNVTLCYYLMNIFINDLKIVGLLLLLMIIILFFLKFLVNLFSAKDTFKISECNKDLLRENNNNNTNILDVLTPNLKSIRVMNSNKLNALYLSFIITKYQFQKLIKMQ